MEIAFWLRRGREEEGDMGELGGEIGMLEVAMVKGWNNFGKGGDGCKSR